MPIIATNSHNLSIDSNWLSSSIAQFFRSFSTIAAVCAAGKTSAKKRMRDHLCLSTMAAHQQRRATVGFPTVAVRHDSTTSPTREGILLLERLRQRNRRQAVRFVNFVNSAISYFFSGTAGATFALTLTLLTPLICFANGSILSS